MSGESTEHPNEGAGEARGTYYDRYWSDGGFRPAAQDAGPQLAALLTRHVVPDALVVDIGCGDGSRTGGVARRLGARYSGFDVSHQAVELAVQAGFDAQVISDASAIPLADGTADLVVCSEVLEHLFDPLAAVHEMLRLVKPDGRVVVTVPNIAYWRNRLDLALLGRWHPGGDDRAVAEPWRDPHIRFFTPTTLLALLRSAGAQIVESGALHEESLLERVPGARRLARGRAGGRGARLLAGRRPALFGYRLFVVAGPAAALAPVLAGSASTVR